MARRLGVAPPSLYEEMSRNPHMVVLRRAVSEADWKKIVGYYIEHAPADLPPQSLPDEPQLDPPFFLPGPFIPGMQSSGVITLLKADSANQRIFVGEAGSNTLRIFDYDRHLKTTVALASAPTDVISERSRIAVLESGNLAPNDDPSGSLVQYDIATDGTWQRRTTLIDSLFRPAAISLVAGTTNVSILTLLPLRILAAARKSVSLPPVQEPM